jgi:hypothetical protein
MKSTFYEAAQNIHRNQLPITLNLLLSGLRLEIDKTIRSGMILFLTSEVLPSLFLASIQPANPYSLIQQISSSSSTLDLLSEHSLSRRMASRPFPATSVKGERYRAFLNFILLQTLSFRSVPQSTESHPPVPEVVLPSLSRKIFKSREGYSCGNFRRKYSRSRYMCRLYRIVLSITNHNPDQRRFGDLRKHSVFLEKLDMNC